VPSIRSRDWHELSKDAWIETGRRFGRERLGHQRAGSQMMWEVGDWLVGGEDRVLRHEQRQSIRELAAQLTGYAKHTLSMAVSVSRKVPPSMRIEGLSWWHHLVVANLQPEQQTEWLTQAAEQEWTVRKLRHELRAGRPRPTQSRAVSRPGDRLVKRLVGLKRDQISDSFLEELATWWQREMDSEDGGP
jgi:hypothetical protein